MRVRWARVPARPGDNLKAGAVAAGVAAAVGLATFYLTRLLLAREPLAVPRRAADREEGPAPPPSGPRR